MTKNTKTSQKPSHDIFAVKEGADDKAFWTKIGAAWPHKDGKGFSLKIDLYPTSGQRVELRLKEERSDEAGQ